MSDYTTVLKQNNLKSTHQRVAILEVIDKAGHIDIETLLYSLKKSFPTMSQGTLYRNVNDLTNKGILTEVKTQQQKQKYEILKEPHIHLECEKCTKLEDLHIDTNKFIENVTIKSGYTILNSQIVLSGICKECQKS